MNENLDRKQFYHLPGFYLKTGILNPHPLFLGNSSLSESVFTKVEKIFISLKHYSFDPNPFIISNSAFKFLWLKFKSFLGCNKVEKDSLFGCQLFIHMKFSPAAAKKKVKRTDGFKLYL